jgi:PAS domain S-box-containing protein
MPKFESKPTKQERAMLARKIATEPIGDELSALHASEKRAEELRFRLEQQARILDITLSSISDFAYIFDREGRFVFANKALLDLWGLKLEEAIGKNFFDLKYPFDLAERLHTQIRTVFETRVGLTDQTEYFSKTGAGGWFEYIFCPVFDRHGKVELVAGSTRDITEHKRTEKQLEAARAELEDRVLARTVELNHATDSLRNLSAKLLQIRDEEGRRLARDLHDSAGQMLAAIAMNISIVKGQLHKLDEDGSRAVCENDELIREITREIRTVSYLLHPPLLDELGLQSGLGWYVDGFSQRSQIKVTLEIGDDVGRLPSELETAIFRVVQECLTNIHRHSGSPTALIQVRREPAKIVVVVQDRGRGMTEDKLARAHAQGLAGVGFRGMTERLRHLGGTLDLHSDTTGTVVTATFPVATPDPPSS